MSEMRHTIDELNRLVQFSPLPSERRLAARVLGEIEERERAERAERAWREEAERLRPALERLVAAYRATTLATGWLERDRPGGISPSEWIGPIFGGPIARAQDALDAALRRAENPEVEP